MVFSDRSRGASPLRPGFNSVTSYKPEGLSVADHLHPVINAGRVAVITGAASGIGKAAALEFAKYAYLLTNACVIGKLTGSACVQ